MIKTYICKFCHSEFTLDHSKAGGFMSAHQRMCEANPNRQMYLDMMRQQFVIGGVIANRNQKQRYLDSIKEYTFVCQNCGNEYSKQLSKNAYKDYLKSSKFYCSPHCSHSRKLSKESREKISNSLRKKPIKYCKDCNKQLQTRNKSGYCNKCIQKHINSKPEVKEKLKQKQLERVKKGLHKGWISRNIVSYPEHFWKQVLDNNHIKYDFNYPISKLSLGFSNASNYFLDFKIGTNVDLEIDGKQHQYKDRKESDKIRDEALIKNGWLVYRIPWNEINSENGKLQMKKKINDFLIWLKNQK